jgi:hypothetical protein
MARRPIFIPHGGGCARAWGRVYLGARDDVLAEAEMRG